MSMTLCIGRRFASFMLWLRRKKTDEEENKIIWSTRRSDLISALPENQQKSINPELRYWRLHYVCKGGDQYHQSVAANPENISSYKVGCKAFLKLHLSRDEQCLEITDLNLIHTNHPHSEAFYSTYPENRRVPQDVKEEVMTIMRCGGKNMNIEDWLHEEKNIEVTLKDVNRIRASIKNRDPDLHEAIRIIEEKGGQVKILHDGKELKGLYFSTPDMRYSMSAWPEVVAIDGTYGLMFPEMTVMTMTVQDSNNCTEIVALAFIISEDTATFTWMLNCFKSENEEACTRIRCFMADKDLLERNLIKDIFKVPVLICMFHTSRIFWRQISYQNMKISNDERILSLRLLQKLMYARCEEEYDEIYEEFIIKVPEIVRKYFDENWHDIRTEWSYFGMVTCGFDNTTNNKLESVHQKYKIVIPLHGTIQSCVKGLFSYMRAHAKETKVMVARMFNKKQVKEADDKTVREYKQLLTDAPFTDVHDEYKRHFKIDLTEEGEKYFIRSGKRNLVVTNSSCQCSFHVKMSLPCRHIFAVRKHLKENLFSRDLCLERWTKDYYRQHQRSFRSATTKIPLVKTDTQPTHISKVIVSVAVTERGKLLTVVSIDIVKYGSLSSGIRYTYRVSNLEDILDLWKRKISFSVISVTGEKTLEESLAELSISTEPPENNYQIKKREKCISNFMQQFKLILIKEDEENFKSKYRHLQLLANYWRKDKDVYFERKQSSDDSSAATKNEKNNSLDAQCTTINGELYAEDEISINEIQL